MKFYYKGQLVRTSKTHAYNWAILEEKDDGTLCTGRSSGYRAEPSGADLRPVYEAGPRELR